MRDRADKAPICRRLGVTHFVDDRLSVLNHLADVDRRVLFTGGLGVHPAPPMDSVPAGIAVMSSWPEAVRYLLDSLRGYSGTR